VSGLFVAPADPVWFDWVSRGSCVRFAVRFGVFAMFFAGLGRVWRLGGLMPVLPDLYCFSPFEPTVSVYVLSKSSKNNRL
jgi:hypothetical protein